MKRLILTAALLLPGVARAQYLDGLPPAASVTGSDIMPICQGGTAGRPGTCTTRKATIEQIQGAALTSITIGSTTIGSGTSGDILFDNAGALGQMATTGSGSVVLGTAPTISNANLTGTTAAAAVTATGIVTGSGLVTTASTPSAGQVGEYITSNVSPSAVSLVNGVAKTIASISLTAGNWDVHGNIDYFAASGTTSTQFLASISQTNNTPPPGNVAEGSTFLSTMANPAGETPELPTGTIHLHLTTTTTIYLVGYSVFTISTMQAYGIISATRTP